MHIGGLLLFDGPAAAVRGRARPRPRAPAPAAALPPEARDPARGTRPAAVGRRSAASTSSTTCATPRCPLQEARRSCSRWPRASPHSALDRTKPLWEFWLVEGIEPAPGQTRERFAMISKTHHALVDGVSGVDLATVLLDFSPDPPPARHRRACNPGSRGPSRTRPNCCWPAHAVARERSTGWPPARSRPFVRPARSVQVAARRRRGRRGDRLGGAEPGARDAAERADRAAPPLPRRAPASSPTTRRSRTASGAPSTMSCWPSWPGRSEAGCARAGSAPTASRCARWCRSRCAPRMSTARSATA